MQNVLTAAAVFHINIKELSSSEYKLFNSIIIYKSIFNAVVQIETVINDYTSLWKKHSNMINLFENEWMNISLMNN